MSKFSGTQTLVRPTQKVVNKGKSVVQTTNERKLTHEGAAGFARDEKSELFLLAISNMVGEDTFYESAKDRDNRFRKLIHKVTKSDPEWVAKFIPYLRNTMQMRSASTVMAVEYGRALEGVDRKSLAQNLYPRHVLYTGISRADELAEAVGYYFSVEGRNLPMWFKRGVSDAARKFYTERNALKYDGQSKDIRFGDVIELVHAKPGSDEQSSLFKYLIERRHNRDEISTEGLEMINRAIALQSMPVKDRRAWLESDEFNPELLELAGFTWERLSGWIQGPMDAKAWEAIIPSMGYMALIRNLRNFTDAGISNKTVQYIINKLTDPDEVRKSRQFPFRFYSAYKSIEEASSLAKRSVNSQYALALEQALRLSFANIPYFKDNTLVLIDVSGSMVSGYSSKSTIQRWEQAALFGIAIGHRAENADVYTYSNGPSPLHLGSDILVDMSAVRNRCGGGTDTFGSLHKTYKNHDRVIILTDEQAHPAFFGQSYYGGYYNQLDPATILNKIDAPIYTFNLAGYQAAQMENGKNGRFAFGGLTDAGFRMIDLLEKYQEGVWPWMDN